MRPEILFPLFAPSASIKGVGPKIAPLVERAAGPLVRDLLFLSPQNLIERGRAKVEEAREGEVQTFAITIDAHYPPARSSLPYRIRAVDETGFMFINWFKGHGPHLLRQHPLGAERAVSGRVDVFNIERQITHPDYLLPLAQIDAIPVYEPVYPTTAGLAPRTLRKIVLEALTKAPTLPEWQDAAWLTRQAWPGWREAMEHSHAPQSLVEMSPDAAPRRRLAYDELLAHQLAMAQRKALSRTEPAPPIAPSNLASRLEAALPFALTGAQIRSLAEIRNDLASGQRMSRIVQGDVGSGKTVVAMLAMADAVAAGKQAVLMAPTEILARQHFETVVYPFENMGVTTVLLTGRDKGPGRQGSWEGLRPGPLASPSAPTRCSRPTWRSRISPSPSSMSSTGSASPNESGCRRRALRCTCWRCPPRRFLAPWS